MISTDTKNQPWFLISSKIRQIMITPPRTLEYPNCVKMQLRNAYKKLVAHTHNTKSNRLIKLGFTLVLSFLPLKFICRNKIKKASANVRFGSKADLQIILKLTKELMTMTYYRAIIVVRVRGQLRRRQKHMEPLGRQYFQYFRLLSGYQGRLRPRK